MALHFSKIGLLKSKLQNEEELEMNFEDKKFICE